MRGKIERKVEMNFIGVVEVFWVQGEEGSLWLLYININFFSQENGSYY